MGTTKIAVSYVWEGKLVEEEKGEGDVDFGLFLGCSVGVYFLICSAFLEYNLVL